MAILYDITKLIEALDDKSAKKIKQLYNRGMYSSVLKLLQPLEKNASLPHDLWKLKVDTLYAMNKFQAALEENTRLLEAFGGDYDSLLGQAAILEQLHEYGRVALVLAKLESELDSTFEALTEIKERIIKKAKGF